MEAMVSPPEKKSPWPGVVALLGLASLALVAYVFHSTRSLPADVLDSGRSLVEAFKSGTVTTRFIGLASGNARMTRQEHRFTGEGFAPKAST